MSSDGVIKKTYQEVKINVIEKCNQKYYKKPRKVWFKLKNKIEFKKSNQTVSSLSVIEKCHQKLSTKCVMKKCHQKYKKYKLKP